jgi:uncharacterized cupredoxin-like copper-binding protein
VLLVKAKDKRGDIRKQIMRGNYKQVLVCLCVFLLLTACAGLQQQVTVGPEKGEKELPMKAESFKFEPNNIKAYEGDVIVLKVKNISGAAHNFTIEDPRENIIQSVDLPSNKTVEITVILSEVGTYNFYCNKPFHKLFGMKGQIEVFQR